MRRLALVTGEPSGDLLASLVLPALPVSTDPAAEAWQVEGVIGPRCAALGAQASYPMERLAVRGYVEVLRHYRGIVRIRDELTQHWLSHRPDVFLGVDAPDFNLVLEQRLRSAGVPVAHLVGPSIWAWRPERINKIRDAVDHMMVLFPFEEAIYRDAGVPVTFVGHPLAAAIPQHIDRVQARERLGVSQDVLIGLLPGSRMDEVELISPRLLQAAAQLHRQRPDLVFAAPMAGERQQRRFEALLARWAPGLPCQVLRGRAGEVLSAARAAWVGSGTATLEAALYRCPMVISYVMPRLSWWLTRRKMLQPWVGLPNILSGRFVVPERLQDEATSGALVADLMPLIDDEARRAAVLQTFANLHESLLADTSQRVADVVNQLAVSRPRG